MKKTDVCKRKMTGFCVRMLTCMLLLILFAAEAAPVQALSTKQKTLGKYGMTPIYGRDIADGSYEIKVESSSAFFKILHAELIVSGDEMTGSVTIGSHSYLYTYCGSKEEAEAAAETDWIPYTLDPDEEDYAVFTFPVRALNSPIPCAAYSKKKKRWYDRDLLFDATTLPAEALLVELPDYDRIAEGLALLAQNKQEAGEGAEGQDDQSQVYGEAAGDPFASGEAMEVPYEDGEYSIEVSMTGGTGRAAISSPTLMIVQDGKAYAKLLWSSSHYDWMIVGGQTYYNANTDGGNSYFIVPISDMDRVIEVVADTTAMGDPVAISYSITYYADTIGNKGLIPQEAAKKVIILAAVITIVGGILNHLVKKKQN